MCDRCAMPTSATEIVTCWQGCPHAQCASCATWTAVEAIEEATYDQEVKP
jgi:hypothetical protein